MNIFLNTWVVFYLSLLAGIDRVEDEVAKTKKNVY
jgi:hypothetical protein